MNILIADDHPLFLEALHTLVTNLYPAATIISANSYTNVLETLKQDTQVDCLFIDLSMPGGDPYEQIKNIRQQFTSLPIIVVTGSESAEDCRMALACGASIFLSKSLDNNALEREVISALSDISLFKKHESESGVLSSYRNNITENLTKRQKEVFDLLCEGDANKVIAKKLFLTEGTVKLHVRAILQALGVKNRTQAAAYKKI
jgi:DNA-binding NarL/FixJ family response regulator